RALLALGLTAATLDGAAHEHERVPGAGDAAANQEQILFRHQLHHALVEHGDALAAGMARHLATRHHAARRHVGADRAAVTLVLVRAVRRDRALEVVTAHDAGEAATARDALHVHHLSDFEHRVDAQLL